MVTREEFCAEIRAEVSRREAELRTQLREAVAFHRSHGGKHLPYRGDPRQIQDDLELLTGVPARLSELQLRALKNASGLGFAVADELQVGGRVPAVTLLSLEKRGLMVVERDHRGRVRSARLTEAGSAACVAIEAERARRRERRGRRVHDEH